jgi:tetrahedral aminopeptidase
MLEELGKLSVLDGPSGFEHPVAEYMQRELKPHADTVTRDRLGNVIAYRKGKSNLKIMLAAHMDEIGLITQHITEDGFIKFDKIGGWDDRILPSMPFKILAKKTLYGTVGTKPPHILTEAERNLPMKIEDLFIDTGLSAQELKKAGVRIGTPMVPASEFHQGNGVAMGKAFDDRAGCLNMLNIMRRLKRTEATIYAVGTVQEEVGTRGAHVASQNIQPDIGIVLEGTIAADVPGVAPERQPTSLRGGAALTVMDRTMITDSRLLEVAVEVAEREKVTQQFKKPSFGGTDAGPIHMQGIGAPSCVISAPCRYIHSGYAITSEEGLQSVVKLASALISDLTPKKLREISIFTS